MLPLIEAFSPPDVRWFSGGGCVVEHDGVVEVSVGGVLVGRYEAGDVKGRNVILVGLAQDKYVHLGQLASAFDLSTERLRQIRHRFDRDGLEGLIGGTTRRPRASKARQLEPLVVPLFEQGLTVTQAWQRVSRKASVGRATIGRIHVEWKARKAGVAEAGAASTTGEEASQTELTLESRSSGSQSQEEERPEASANQATATATRGCDADRQTDAALVSAGDIETESLRRPHGPIVQHAGGLLLLAALERYGLYDEARTVCAREQLDADTLRVAFDAFALALSQGEPCIEGVRRLATPTMPELLRATRRPSADWVRRTIGGFADAGAEPMHFGMARRYLALARGQAGPAVYYVDNHMRPYTGKHTIRKGWRMQDKRAKPGISDYYIHDEEGRPVLRIESPSHAPLTDVLLEVADWLRAALGEDQRLLLAFDRAGAFANTLAALKGESFEFVTYERRPYRMLRPSEFKNEMTLERPGQQEPERLRWREFWVGLGKGRGDVRRIALRTEDERQVNLVAMSQEPPERLVAILRRRWRQENAFKHSVERWGVNHLDGRKTRAYAPDTIIPNPARSALDRALRMACVKDGLARRQLADDSLSLARRQKAMRDLNEAIALQQELIERRRSTPKRAALGDTGLAGKLVYHSPSYKLVLDTLRICCANAEADLAETLAPFLPRPAEAKKILATLMAAPGNLHLGRQVITLELSPAANGPEQQAFHQFYRRINEAKLCLPGDPKRRRLCLVPQTH